jgi:hypothetical protein
MRLMADDSEEAIPHELLEPPSGDVPPPLAQTAQQELPFGVLLWTNFERLCVRLARLGGDLGGAIRLYGTEGQLQYGIDFYVALPSGRYHTYQCKRLADLKPSDIKAAVDEFLRRRGWAKRSDRFTFCTSASARSTALLEAIEVQRARLRSRAKPIQFEVWDAEELAAVLRDQEEIVQTFFGGATAGAFFGRPVEQDRSTEDLLDALIEKTRGRTQFVTNDWASERLRVLLDELRASDPDGYAKLNEQLGSPPDAGLLRATVRAPPQWLQEAAPAVWDVLARTGESLGEWAAASQAWVELAGRQACAYSRAGALVSGAVAARMAKDEERYEELIVQAEAASAEHPRLVLEGMSEDMPPAEQRAILENLKAVEIEDEAQIAARRALAEILTPDVEAAREWVEKVEELLPGSILASSLRVSLTVQIGRLSVMAHRTLESAALLGAAEEAQKARERLIEQARYSEATRLVMLRADVHALLNDRESASRILKGAQTEELQTTEQKEVLASSAAERALDWRLAQTILEDAEETAAVVRLRLEIIEAIGSPGEREGALAGLDRIVEDGGPEAGHAAFVRLAATLGSKTTAWSEAAAVYLKQNGFERAAVQAEAFYRSQHDGYEAALGVLTPYGDEPWVLATRLRLAVAPGAPHKDAQGAAEALLAIGPSHATRVEAALGFAHAGKFGRARTELITVARDPNAPGAARADAFSALMRVAGDEIGDWELVSELHMEWVEIAPTDDRSSKWASRIANRVSRLKER